jgi:hypothetical protein
MIRRARTVAGSSLSSAASKCSAITDATLGEVRQEKRAPQFLSFTVQDDLSGLAPDAVRVYVDDELAWWISTATRRAGRTYSRGQRPARTKCASRFPTASATGPSGGFSQRF